MALEDVKKILLNLSLAVSGFVAGKMMGGSGKVHSMIDNLGKNFFGARESKQKNEEAEIPDDAKDNSLRNLKDHYQRKEGFRQ